MSVRTGDIVNSKYRVEHVLGEGGMGIVVAARHLELGELYAIKVMKREALGGDAFAERRFIGEARAAARLKGEHVARVHDIGRLDTGELYMVMEYLKGTDLKKVVRERGPLPVQEAVTYVLQTCEAIAEAHALDIIHRDIKPHNLFLVEGGSSIKVLDFGISKQPTVEGPDFTGTNMMLGTLSYMSPEQMEQSKRVDARSDVWSIGVVLYELVTGEVPFPGQGVFEIFRQVSKGDPTPPSQRQPGLPTAVDAVVARCLQRDPAQRFGSVNELARALRSLIVPSSARAGSPIAPSPEGAGRPIARLPVSAAAVFSVDSTPPVASVSDARTTKKRQGSLVQKPAPVFHLTDAPTHPALRTETSSEPTWSMEGSHHGVRRGWRWGIGFGALCFVVLTLVAFQGWVTRSAATPQPGEGTHDHRSSANVRQPSGTSQGADVQPRGDGNPGTNPSAALQPPSSTGSNPTAQQPSEKTQEASPSTKVPPPSETGRSANLRPPSESRQVADHKPRHVPLLKNRTHCPDPEFPYFNVNVYTTKRRSRYILAAICAGGPDRTKLCCVRPEID
jgi:serine/threonine-protein kinase